MTSSVVEGAAKRTSVYQYYTRSGEHVNPINMGEGYPASFGLVSNPYPVFPFPQGVGVATKARTLLPGH